MEYYDSNNRVPRRCGYIALGLYVVIIALLMFFTRFTYEVVIPPEEGILVEFGDSDMGFGEEELLATDITAPAPPTAPEPTPDEIATDQESDVEIDKPAQEVTVPKQPEVSDLQPTPTDSVVVEQRTVNQQALFPGRKEESSSTSSGTSANTVGNQGAESGGDKGGTEGSGEGLTGYVELKNRSIVGELPKPNYNANAAGKVIIDITVDETGRVNSATYRAEGSTTNNSVLIAAAQAAALKARFTNSDDFIQAGTITYIFKLN